MSFDIFDERFYLANNPDVANAVQSGTFTSGLQHFQQNGLEGGRVLVSPLFNEQLYLQAYPDVANAVGSGAFRSGLQHFIQSGEAEGRLGLFGLYNEQAYLQRYPDVANAVQSGSISSGFQHFVRYSADEGRFDALFNEQYYLNKYPDVANAVSSGAVSSGLEHFLNFGLKENRSGGANFNEGFYLRKYPDVANAVRSGAINSGLEHFAQFGEAQGRAGTYFAEDAYRFEFSDVATGITSGAFTSGIDHYLQYGQYEDSRNGIFTGTSGNDIVRSFGKDTALVGVDFESTDQLIFGPKSLGVGETDTLIGLGGGQEIFLLGTGSDASTGAQKFYIGGGNSDYALIRYFNIEQDFLQLAGSSSDYTQTVVNGSVNISTSSGDLIGIVEGVSAVLTAFTDTENGTFLLG